MCETTEDCETIQKRGFAIEMKTNPNIICHNMLMSESVNLWQRTV